MCSCVFMHACVHTYSLTHSHLLTHSLSLPLSLFLSHNHTYYFSQYISLICSPSDLEADDEDNQDYDSLTMSDSTLSLVQPASSALPNLHSSNSLQTTRPPANGRPATPTTESVDEVLLVSTR